MVPVTTIVNLCIAQRGDAYQWGAVDSPADPNPSAFDCSSLVKWACDRAAVAPPMPRVSGDQFRHCRAAGLEVSIAKASTTYGALLFEGPEGADHVVVSLGNGQTIEARGHAYGVNEFGIAGRPWSCAALIPGVDYGVPITEDDMPLTPPQAQQLTNAERDAGLARAAAENARDAAHRMEAGQEQFERDLAAIKAKVGA